MSTELNILKVAILTEQEGYQFYKAASERVTNAEAKQAFLQFADEEKAHEEMLRNMYEQLRRGSRTAVYDPDAGGIPQPRIFGRKDTLISDDYELAAYRMAILFEEAAIRFYTENAERTDSQEVKKLLLDLAAWETAHRDTFAATYEQLREAWWKKESL